MDLFSIKYLYSDYFQIFVRGLFSSVTSCLLGRCHLLTVIFHFFLFSLIEFDFSNLSPFPQLLPAVKSNFFSSPTWLLADLLYTQYVRGPEGIASTSVKGLCSSWHT